MLLCANLIPGHEKYLKNNSWYQVKNILLFSKTCEVLRPIPRPTGGGEGGGGAARKLILLMHVLRDGVRKQENGRTRLETDHHMCRVP